MAGKRVVTESGDAARLFFFSDAVVAIAMTLLALELPVPDSDSTSELWHSVRANAGHYAAFAISFAVIAAAWSQHHHALRFVVRTDDRLRRWNMAWLFTIVVIPFATKLMTSADRDADVTHAYRFGFYALVQVLAGCVFLAMVRHIVAGGLDSDDAPAGLAGHAYQRSIGFIAGFGLSIPLFFLVSWAWVTWILGPVVVGAVTRRHASSEHRNNAG